MISYMEQVQAEPLWLKVCRDTCRHRGHPHPATGFWGLTRAQVKSHWSHGGPERTRDLLNVTQQAGIRLKVKVLVTQACQIEDWPSFSNSSVGKEWARRPWFNPWVGKGSSAGEGIGYPLRYSWASHGAQLVKNPPEIWGTWVWSLGWEEPLEKGKATHSRILAYTVHGVAKSRTWLSNFHFQSGIKLKTGQGSGITVSKPRGRQPAHQPVPHQTPCLSLTLAEMSLDQVRLDVILFPALSPIPHVSLFNLSFWFYLLNIISTVKPRFKLRPQDCSASGLSTPRADPRSPHKKHQRPLVAFKRPSHVTAHEFRQTQILLQNPQQSRFLCEVLTVAITCLKITSFLF